MAGKKVTPGVLASFEHIDLACDTIRSLRSKGRKEERELPVTGMELGQG